MKRIVMSSMLLLAFASCKGETIVKDNPQTVERLNKCESNLKAKVEYINTLSSRNNDLESGASDNEAGVVIAIEGEIVKITAGKSKGPNSNGSSDVKGTAKDAELYKAFVAQVRRSRGAIKKCYQHALKKNSALSSRTVSLTIGVAYRTSGAVRKATFSPRVSEQFNQCMKGVATKWKVPAMPRSISFSYKQTLTPE